MKKTTVVNILFMIGSSCFFVGTLLNLVWPEGSE